jgi:hypothetical protein
MALQLDPSQPMLDLIAPVLNSMVDELDSATLVIDCTTNKLDLAAR